MIVTRNTIKKMRLQHQTYFRISHNKYLSIFTLICFFSVFAIQRVDAQEDNARGIDTDIHSVIRAKTPIMRSGNPASLYYSPVDSFIILATQYSHQSGNFKSISTGDELNGLCAQTFSFQRLDKVMLYGSFDYLNQKEQGMQYSNTYHVRHDTPYLFADTIGGDTYKREQFVFTGALAYSVTSRFAIGGKVNYMTGYGAQDRDPRTQNKISTTLVSIGGMYQLTEQLKLGGDLFYNYYNEDIETIVVEKDAVYTIFNLTGLGTYSKHKESTFYRLYQRNAYGSNIQFEWKNNLLTAGYKKFKENVYDGRRESGANWSARKHDSEYRNNTWKASYIYTLRPNDFVHQFSICAKKADYIGSEPLQKLIKLNENNVYQWTTIAKEDKYTRKQEQLRFSYELSKFRSRLQRNYWIGFEMDYFNHSEQYYVPDMSLNYKNLYTQLEAGKYIKMNKSGCQINLVYGWNKNLDRDTDFTYDNFITERIIVPDYLFFSSGHNSVKAQIEYDFKIDANKYCVGLNYNLHNQYSSSNKRGSLTITLSAFL